MPRLAPLGDCALLVDWGQRLDPGVNAEVHRLARRIQAAGIPGLRDVVPAYASLAVHWDPADERPFGQWEARIERLLQATGADDGSAERRIAIPVRYGGEGGPDLEDVAGRSGLSPAEFALRHARGSYRVFMLGFTPGFPYLGGMDPALAAPRRETPRASVPAGSVGIAGLQSGIYPVASPGGWQIIGRTEARLFDPDRAEPCLLRPGDSVRFVDVEPAP